MKTVNACHLPSLVWNNQRSSLTSIAPMTSCRGNSLHRQVYAFTIQVIRSNPCVVAAPRPVFWQFGHRFALTPVMQNVNECLVWEKSRGGYSIAVHLRSCVQNPTIASSAMSPRLAIRILEEASATASTKPSKPSGRRTRYTVKSDIDCSCVRLSLSARPKRFQKWLQHTSADPRRHRIQLYLKTHLPLCSLSFLASSIWRSSPCARDVRWRRLCHIPSAVLSSRRSSR